MCTATFRPIITTETTMQSAPFYATFSETKEMHMRFQDTSLTFAQRNPCPVCGAETALAEIEPHPLHVNFEIHGYLCDRCGPVKSLVVLRSWSPALFQ